MRRSRWQDLDWGPSEPKQADPVGGLPAAPPSTDGKRRHGALSGLATAPHPAVATARGFYLLRNWARVVEALSPEALDAAPSSGGAWLLRALALARLGELDAAELAFDQAAVLAQDDAFTHCAHAAFALHRGRPADARAQLERCGSTLAEKNPVAEQLWAACAWAKGQGQLSLGAAGEAARWFATAGERFVAAAAALMVARQALPERLSAVYIGEATSRLSAGHWDAALQLYARLRPAGMRFTPPIEQFARDLHELCRLLSQTPAVDRHAALEPLTALVTGTQMLVDLWDGGQPVRITWHGGWEG